MNQLRHEDSTDHFKIDQLKKFAPQKLRWVAGVEGVAVASRRVAYVVVAVEFGSLVVEQSAFRFAFSIGVKLLHERCHGFGYADVLLDDAEAEGAADVSHTEQVGFIGMRADF